MISVKVSAVSDLALTRWREGRAHQGTIRKVQRREHAQLAAAPLTVQRNSEADPLEQDLDVPVAHA